MTAENYKLVGHTIHDGHSDECDCLTLHLTHEYGKNYGEFDATFTKRQLAEVTKEIMEVFLDEQNYTSRGI